MRFRRTKGTPKQNPRLGSFAPIRMATTMEDHCHFAEIRAA